MLEAEAIAQVSETKRRRSESRGTNGSSRGRASRSRDSKNRSSPEKKPFDKFNYLKSLEKTRFSPVKVTKPKNKRQNSPIKKI